MDALQVPMFVLGSISLIVLAIFLVVVLVFVPFAINLKVDPDNKHTRQPFWRNMGIWTSRWSLIVGTLYGIFLVIMVLVIGATYMGTVLS